MFFKRSNSTNYILDNSIRLVSFMQIKLQKYFFSSLLKPLEILLVQNAILTKVLCYKQITKESSILVVRNGRLLPFIFIQQETAQGWL